MYDMAWCKLCEIQWNVSFVCNSLLRFVGRVRRWALPLCHTRRFRDGRRWVSCVLLWKYCSQFRRVHWPFSCRLFAVFNVLWCLRRGVWPAIMLCSRWRCTDEVFRGTLFILLKHDIIGRFSVVEQAATCQDSSATMASKILPSLLLSHACEAMKSIKWRVASGTLCFLVVCLF